MQFCFSAFKKTSLVKPIGVFVQFLKGLESENDTRRKNVRDTEGWWTFIHRNLKKYTVWSILLLYIVIPYVTLLSWALFGAFFIWE